MLTFIRPIRLSCIIIGLFLVFQGAAIACADSESLGYNRLEEYPTYTEDCASNQLEYYHMVEQSVDASDELSTDFFYLDLNQSSNSNYWEGWDFEQREEPFLTSQYYSSFFGLSVWMPEESEISPTMGQYSEWLLNHGVQFSVGIGNENGDTPRLRLDYKWHKDYAADLMLQLALPF